MNPSASTLGIMTMALQQQTAPAQTDTQLLLTVLATMPCASKSAFQQKVLAVCLQELLQDMLLGVHRCWYPVHPAVRLACSVA
jgi:hypothetical protein